jgi:hypothetical protein
MFNLIESSEFGDWLLAEIPKAAAQSRSANVDRALAAGQRREALKVAKKVLLEFLTLQQAMLEAAEVRRQRPLRTADPSEPAALQTQDTPQYSD